MRGQPYHTARAVITMFVSVEVKLCTRQHGQVWYKGACLRRHCCTEMWASAPQSRMACVGAAGMMVMQKPQHITHSFKDAKFHACC